jgi:hypothetical protein
LTKYSIIAIILLIKKKEKKMSDTEIGRIFKMPISTMQDFKNKDKDDWRYRVYTFIKQQPKENLEHFLKVNKLEKKK